MLWTNFLVQVPPILSTQGGSVDSWMKKKWICPVLRNFKYNSSLKNRDRLGSS